MKLNNKIFLVGISTEILYVMLVFAADRWGYILILQFVIYYLGWRNQIWKRVSLRWIFGFTVLFNLTLGLVWNITSNDLYTYIFWGRVHSVYNANPYLVAYDELSYDPFYEEIKSVWSSKTAVYGPLITLSDSVLSRIGSSSLALTIYIYKAFYVLINIFCAWLIYWISKSKLSLYLYAWNPLVLFELVGNNHNDIFLIFFLMLSFYFLLSKFGWRRLVVGVALFWLSVLSKYTSLIVAPILYLYCVKRVDGVGGKFWVGVVWVLVAVFLAVLLYMPFWEVGIFDRVRLVSGAVTSVPSPALFLISKRTGMLIVVACLLVVYLNGLVRPVNKETLFVYSAVVYGVYFAFGMGLFLPWYPTTLIALTSLRESKWTLGITLLSMCVYLWI